METNCSIQSQALYFLCITILLFRISLSMDSILRRYIPTIEGQQLNLEQVSIQPPVVPYSYGNYSDALPGSPASSSASVYCECVGAL
jgi:hypothetical protein